jgi:tRNA pseudouridine55 synthase
MATGVLVLLIGPATRLSRFATAGRKRYHAVIRYGQTTTTYDAEGELTHECPVDLKIDDLVAALDQFRGEIQQVPPMYAAVRVNGKKLYELAREGKVVQRDARPVTIYRLEILDWQSPELELDVLCSAGTYVRSLAHDLGQRLGCGAHLSALRRTANGPFQSDDCYNLDELRKLETRGELSTALRPPHAVLVEMPLAIVSRSEEQAIRYGQRVSLSTTPPSATGDMIQARDEDDHLVAILSKLDTGLFQPKVVFPDQT